MCGVLHMQVVHRLTARAVIQDWEAGLLSDDRTHHEVEFICFVFQLFFSSLLFGFSDSGMVIIYLF